MAPAERPATPDIGTGQSRLSRGVPPDDGAVTRPSGAAIDTIVCDVGGVVIEFSPERCAEIERRHGIRAGALLPAMLKTPAARLAAVGRLDLDQWYRQTAELVGAGAVDDWLAYRGELNQPVVDILTKARSGGVCVLLLSNATTRLWDDLDHHGVRRIADRVFCSANIGHAKPDLLAYQFVADAESLDPDRVLYIDDTPSWVDAGRRLGWRGHVYSEPENLRRALTELGVDV